VTVNETAFKLITKEEYNKNSRVLSKYYNIKISNLVKLFFVSAIIDVNVLEFILDFILKCTRKSFEVTHPCITVLP
jgi:hypothetical protein